MRRGENIYKRKDGRWEARYVKGRNHDGRIIYGSCYGKTYSEAKSKAEDARKGFTNCSPRKNNRYLFREICDEWLQLNRMRLKQSTYIKYQSNINKYIKPAFGNYILSAVTTDEIGNFSCRLMSQYGLAEKTVQDILVLLHSILKFGARQHPDRLANIEIIYPKRKAQEMRVLSRAEQKLLTCYLLEDLNPCKMGVLLALWTGIRIGELCALQWKHIDLQEQTIKIGATMQRLQHSAPCDSAKTKVIIDSPKTASSDRTIPVSTFLLSLCRNMAQENPNAYVLTGTEKYMEPRLLQYHFRCYTTACGLNGVTFHTLRHTFATRCVEAGFDTKSLSEILGHSSIAVTLSRYVHCSMDLKRENMKKLDLLNP